MGEGGEGNCSFLCSDNLTSLHLRRYSAQLTDRDTNIVCKTGLWLDVNQNKTLLSQILQEMIRRQRQCLIFVETLIKRRNTHTLSPHYFPFPSSQSISRFPKTQVVSRFVLALVGLWCRSTLTHPDNQTYTNTAFLCFCSNYREWIPMPHWLYCWILFLFQ